MRRSTVARGASLEEKLTKNYTTNGECWEYNSGKAGKGYRVIWYDGKQRYAHRLSYEFHKGPIPNGMVVDHICRNRACINPKHLRVVTQKENVRGVQTPVLSCEKHKCKRARRKDGRGLYCPKCSTENSNKWYSKNKKIYDSPGGHIKNWCYKHNCPRTPTNWSSGQAKTVCKQCQHEAYLKYKQSHT